MEEIICPECGRPNLQEAVKCWYCQHPFEKDWEQQKDEETSLAELETEQNPSPSPNGSESAQEKVPNWLQHIRERIQSDIQAEDETEQWQQEVLFDGQKTRKRGSPKKHDAPIKRNKQKIRSQPSNKNPETTMQNPLIDHSTPFPKDTADRHNKAEELKSEAEEPDLPEGFIRFYPKED